MNIFFRIVLIAVSVLTFLFITWRLRKTQVYIYDAIYWVLLSFLFIIFALFPGMSMWLAKFLGMESASNFIFLAVIFVLLIKVFTMSVRLSQVNTKFRELTEYVALLEEGLKSEEEEPDTVSEYEV